MIVRKNTGDDVDSLLRMFPATDKHTWLLMTPGTIQYNTGDDVDSLLRMAPAAGKHTSDASGVIVLSHMHVI